MTFVTHICQQCAVEFRACVAQVRFRGVKFCTQECFGKSRRLDPDQTSAERLASPEFRSAKREYDRIRRTEKREEIAAKKRAAYLADHDRHLEQQRRRRADPATREKHKEIQRRCQARPEWKAHKAQYDLKYRATQDYGEFAEAFLALMALQDEISAVVPDRTDIYTTNGTLNKSQTRKRNADSETQRRRAQGNPVGDAARRQGR